MPNKKVIIIETSEIIRQGFLSMLRNHSYEYNVAAIESIDLNWIQSCNKDECPNILIINPAAIENTPEGVKLLRQEAINHGFKLVAIVYAYFDEHILSMFDEVIFINDDETRILTKLKKLLSTFRESALLEENASLSQRELDVLRLIALGNSNREIAEELCISIHTVISHRKNITTKLGIKSASGLTIYAVINKLINSEDFDKTI